MREIVWAERVIVRGARMRDLVVAEDLGGESRRIRPERRGSRARRARGRLDAESRDERDRDERKHGRPSSRRPRGEVDLPAEKRRALERGVALAHVDCV